MAFIGQTAGVDVALPNAREITTCDSGVSLGDWVYVDSLGVLQKAIATSIITSRVIGIVEAKLNTTSCIVRFSGRALYLFVGLDPTKNYFLSASTAGTMTDVAPITGSGDWVVPLGKPLTTTKFVVHINTRFKRAT